MGLTPSVLLTAAGLMLCESGQSFAEVAQPDRDAGGRRPACTVRDWATPAAPRVVTQVLDGETLKLDDGTEVRLAAILVPALAAPVPAKWPERLTTTEGFSIPNFAPEPPWQRTAAWALSQWVLGRTVELRAMGRGRDRYGRTIAHVLVDVRDGQQMWVQEQLIAEGLARVATSADAAACAPQLLALEDEARAARRGLWAQRAFGVRLAHRTRALRRERNTFQIVVGVVRTVTDTQAGTQLALGGVRPESRQATAPADRRDGARPALRDGAFMLAVSRADRDRFTGPALSLASLKGKRVRVRGWIELSKTYRAAEGPLSGGAPFLRLTHPEQIEVLP